MLVVQKLSYGCHSFLEQIVVPFKHGRPFDDPSSNDLRGAAGVCLFFGIGLSGADLMALNVRVCGHYPLTPWPRA